MHLIETKEIQKEVQGNEKLQGIIEELRRDPISHKDFSLTGGGLFYNNRLVVPRNSKFI